VGKHALWLVALAFLALGPGAQAQEAAPPSPAPLLLKLFDLPPDSPEAAFRESLALAPPARPALEWVILPDGSARYGTARLGVVVAPPCPAAPARVALPGRVPR
jgi:hypothetical protein